MSRPLVVALAVVAIACGGRPTPTRAPASHVLRVGTSGDYPPFSVRVETGYQGLDVEVARRFAQDTGRTLEMVEFRWPALEIDLAAARFDVAVGGVTMRPWRARVGTFTRPIVRAGAVVLVNPDVATRVAQLDVPERRIAVNAGGHLERVARRLFPHAQVKAVPTNLWLPDLFESKQVDAIVSDELEAPYFRSRVSSALTLGPLTRDRKAYLARDPALAHDFDVWLREREADGSLPALRARYLGPQWATPRSATGSDLDALLAILDLRLAFMPSVAIAKEALGLPTRDPAQEERVRARAREQATLLGVSPEPIDVLVVAMLDAGRAAQDAVRATPSADRPPIDAMDLDGEIRPALATLSDGLVATAADYIRDPPDPEPLSADAIAETLDPSVTPAAARLTVARAVCALRGGHWN